MEIITVFNSYDSYRDAVKGALSAAAEDFVYIGYLLRQAKENPSILEGSSYGSYKDFAKQEFNLDESMVSRFININERYADGPSLLPQYQGYGMSKLGEMLSLPPVIAEQLTPDTTREEIRSIKAEIRENDRVTPIERYAERAQLSDDDGNETYRFFVDYFKTHKDEWLQLRSWLDDLDNAEMVSDVLFPNGEGIIRANIKGEGSCMIKSRGTDEDLTITYFADGRKETITWDYFMDAIYAAGDREPCKEFTEESWESLYGKKNAPAQEEKPLTTAPETEEKPDRIEKPKPKAEVVPKSTPTKNIESSEEDTEPDKAAEPIEEEKVEIVEATVEDAPTDKKSEDPKEVEIEEARKLKRIAYGLRALGDQFDAGTGGNLYGNPIEELEGMIDEINSLPGLLIPIVEDAIRRIKLHEEDL